MDVVAGLNINVVIHTVKFENRNQDTTIAIKDVAFN